MAWLRSVVGRRRAAIGAIAVVLLGTGCSTEKAWQRQDVVDWCETWVHPPRHLLYCGSDAQWHHFKARPVDYWVIIKVDRRELRIEDERPVAERGQPGYFGYYAVDPVHGFQKIPE